MKEHWIWDALIPASIILGLSIGFWLAWLVMNG